MKLRLQFTDIYGTCIMEEDEPTENSSDSKLLFFDEMDEEENGSAKHFIQKPSNNIRVSVCSCRREGKDWVYDIEVQYEDTEVKTITRTYKDIEWLYNELTHRPYLGGYILPPLPPSPSSFQALPAAHLIGVAGEAMFGSIGRRYCLPVEVFLQLLADHRYFAENHIVFNYLTKKTFVQPQDSKRLGASLNQLTKIYSDYQLSSITDLDHSTGKVTKYVTALIPQLENSMIASTEVVLSWQHLACQQDTVRYTLQELAAQELKSCSNIASGITSISEALMEESLCAGVASLDMALSLAFTIRHQYGVFLQARDMLHRRLAKMQAFIQATKQLDRASGKKKEVAQEAIVRAEREYKDITDTCRQEITLFQQQYMVALKSALLGHSEAQIAHSKKTFERLAALRDSLAN